MRKLLLLLLIYVGILSSVFAIESTQVDRSADNEQTNKNYFRTCFNYSTFRNRIFTDGIRIKINGSIAVADSLHFLNIIDTIQELIKPQKVELVNFGGNINLYVDHPDYEGTRSSFHSNINEQGKPIKEVVFNFFDVVDQGQRNKMITFYLVRAITDKQVINPAMLIPKSIFSERDPLCSEFLEIDKLMVKRLYSGNPDKYLRESYPSYKEYLRVHHPSTLNGLANVISFIVALLFFIIFVYSEVLNLNADKLFPFVSSGSLIILCFLIFSNVRNNFFIYSSNYVVDYGGGAIYLIAGVVVLSLMYFVEKLLFSLNENIYFKLFVQFLTITVLGGAVHLIMSIIFSGNVDWWYDLFRYEVVYAAIAFARVIYNYQRYKTQQLIMQKDVDLSRLSELKSKAELNALHSRINPHFLYNSLNSIATLARIDAGKTEKMALALSDFCRFAINRDNETYTSVSDEVEVVKSYLEIEKIRFGNRLDYSIELEEGIEDIKIPRFIIQPLIENAIKHGVSKKMDTGIVKLTISKVDAKIHIKVFDNGPDFPEHLLTGHGLQSIHDKLDILYKDEATMNWETGEHKYICITLPIRK